MGGDTRRRWRWQRTEPIKPGKRTPVTYTVAKRLMRWFLFPLLGGAEVHGVENVPAEGGAVIAPNHVSYLDPPFLAGFLPRRTYFMAKRELFEMPLLGWFFHRNLGFPVERGASDRAALQHGVGVLRQGELLAIFPEGTRTSDGRIGPGELGCALVAGRAGVPIIPCAIVGTDRILPRDARRPSRGRLYCAFGEPVRVEPDASGRFSRPALQHATDVLMARIGALHAEMLALREAREGKRRRVG